MNTSRLIRHLGLVLGLLSAANGRGADPAPANAALKSPAAPARPLAAAPARPALAALAATPLRPGALATGELRLIGLQLKAPTETIQAPINAPLQIPVRLYLGDRPATASEIAALVPSTARVMGTLTGPGLSATELVGDPASGLAVPGLPQEGDYLLQNLRIVNGSTVLFESTPPTVNIHCLGEVIISSVTSSPMTMDELRAAGVQLGQGNYEARRFTLGLTVGSQQVDLSIPVAIPVYNGLEEPLTSPDLPEKLELRGLVELVPGLNVGVVDFAPEPTLSLARPEIAHMLRHAFKGVIVIPGSIGYLHQFYKTNVVALNALPSGSPFVVSNLRATFLPPAGLDGAPGTADDPLRAVSAFGEGAEAAKDLKVPGTASSRIAAGESASATWALEGMKEGAHEIRFALQGQFEGPGLQAPIPLQGTARGKILVRNPNFSLSLVHPDVVRKGETYTLEARLTNTSETLANGVSITLDQARLVNARLVGSGTQTVDTLLPGQTHNFSFQLKALRTGEVQASYLYIESGSIGFQLSTGIGERSIRLSPDTLVLPQSLNDLPVSLREALLRVLGQAHSIATTRGALPPGVLPIRANTISADLKPRLNELGLFLRMGVDRTRVLDDLWRMIVRNSDAGLDQLVRTTEAGSEFRAAWLAAYRTWASASPDPGLVLSRDAGLMQAPALASVENAEGLSLGWTSEGGQIASTGTTLLAAPWAGLARDAAGAFAQLPVGAAGSRIVLENPTTAGRTVGLKVAGPFGTPFRLRQAAWRFELPAGGRATVDLAAQDAPMVAVQTASGTSQASPEALSDLSPEPFQALAVHRYDLGLTPSATPFGTQVMVLFNKPLKTLAIPEGIEGHTQASALVQVEANAFWKKTMPKGGFLSDEIIHFPPALVQATPRILSCYLEKPVGPYIARTLTLASEIESADGEGLTGTRTWPVACSDFPGGSIVRGKVRKSSGEALSGSLSYWYEVIPEEGGVDLKTGQPFQENYYALVSSFRSEADGSFQLDYVPEPAKTAVGPFLLAARTASGMAAGEASPLGRGGVIEMDLVLEGRGTLEGTVKDPAGQPIEGATVQAMHDGSGYAKSFGGAGGSATTTTDASGFFRFPTVAVGGYSLRVQKGVLGLASSALVAQDGAVTRVDLVLGQATGTVKVKVLNVDGSVRPNQLVFLGLPGLVREGGSPFFIYALAAETDATGTATFSGVPAGDVRSKIPNVAEPVPLWDGLLAPGGTVEGLLRMVDPEQRAAVEVQVKDRAGNPVADAYAWVDQWHTQFPAGHTDAEGVLTIPAAPNAAFSVSVYHRDFPAKGAHSQLVVPVSGARVVLPVIMPARAFVKGTVKRPDGSLVKKGLVALPPIGGSALTEHYVYTDDLGQYRLGGVDPTVGQRLTALGPDLLTAVNRTVQGTEDQELVVDLVLPEVGQNLLNGTVYQPSETSTPTPTMAYVQVYGELPSLSNSTLGLPMRTFLGERLTGTDGRFSFGPLPTGPFELTASNDAFPRVVKATGTFLGAHDTKTVDLTLLSTDTASLEGHVTLPDGQTPAGAGLRVIFLPNLGATTEALEVLTDASGRYAFPKVLPVSTYGTFYLRVEDPATGLIAVSSLKLDQPRPFLRNVRLWGKGTLTVRLQDSQGRALTAGDVTLTHSLAPFLRPGDLPPLQEALTDTSQGTLTFEGMLEGQVRAEVRTPANLRGVASVTLPEGGGHAEVVVRLQPMGTLTGLVRRADGTPVPAGRVDAYQNGAWIGVSPTRQGGVDGRFEFPPLPAGTVYLQAWDPDTRQAGEATVQLPENGTVDLTLTLQDRGPVVVTVTKEGQPLANATVNLTFMGGLSSGFRDLQSATGASGTVTFEVPPGSYRATATDPLTLAVGQTSFTRRNGDPSLNAAIQLQATRDLAVMVQAPSGFTGSLQGWRVRSSSGRSANLDTSGQALLKDLPVGSHQLTLSDPRNLYRGERNAALTVDGGAVQSASLQALARGQLRVFLKDAGGAGVEGGVKLFGIAGDGERWASAQATIGEFRLLDVLQGARTLRGLSLDGRLQTYGNAQVSAEGEVVDATLTLEATAGFQGALKDALGQPVPFVEVRYGKVGGSYLLQNLALATDGQGVFRASGLPLGTYAISAKLPGRSGSRQVTLATADETATADFNLSAAGHLHGIVTDPLRPIGAVKVTVLQNGALLASTLVESNGAYAFQNLPAGVPLRVEATLDDGFTNAYVGTATIPAQDVDQAFDFILEPRPSLAGKTFASDGSTARPMGLELWEGGYLRRRAGTSTDHPTFRFNYLVPGKTYELRGFEDTAFLATRPVVMQASPETQTFDLVALPQRALTLRLVNADGSPAALTGTVKLTLQAGAKPVYHASFDATGTAALPSVPLGTYRADLSNVPGQPPVTHTFEVVAGSGAQTVDLPLVRTGTLICSVKTQAGRVVSGSNVVVQDVASGRTFPAVPLPDATFRVENVYVGRALRITFVGFPYISGPYAYTLTAPDVETPYVGTTANHATIQGRVLTETGQPLEGADVMALWSEQSPARSGADGRYSMVIRTGTWDLRATKTGRVDHVLATVPATQDGGDYATDLAFPGTGTVEVTVLDRFGAPLSNQAVTLLNASRVEGTRTATTDGAGKATFASVMAGGVTAKAALPGGEVSAGGTVMLNQSLPIELKGIALSPISGRIRRATDTNAWPAGTQAYIDRRFYPMAADGTIQVPAGGILVPSSKGSVEVAVNVPTNHWIYFDNQTLTANQDLVLNLSARPFGTFEARVMSRDGSTPVVGADSHLNPVGPLAKTDATGKTRAAFVEPGSLSFVAWSGTEVARKVVELTTDGQALVLDLRLGDAIQATGLFTLTMGSTFENRPLFQSTGRLESSEEGHPLTLEGTLDGLVWQGTWTEAGTPARTGRFKATFAAPYGDSFTGTFGEGTSETGDTFTGTRTTTYPALYLEPKVPAPLRTGGQRAMTVRVAGEVSPPVTWTTTVGTITAEGLLNAPSIPGSATVRAALASNPANYKEVTVPIQAAVAVSPLSASLDPGGTQAFTATTFGFMNGAVSWSATGGTITAAGVFTAGSTPGTFQVLATSVEDPTQSAAAAVQVLGAVTLRVDVRTSDGRTVAGRVFQVRTPSSTFTATTDASGGFEVQNLAAGIQVTLTDQGGSATNPWTPRIPARTLTTVNGSQGISLILPVGRLTIRVTRDGVPVEGASFQMWLGGYNPGEPFASTVTDAAGEALFVDFPTGKTVGIYARESGTEATADYKLVSQATLTMALPGFSTLTYRIKRAGGGAVPAGPWGWYSSPSAATDGPPEGRTTVTFTRLPQGQNFYVETWLPRALPPEVWVPSGYTYAASLHFTPTQPTHDVDLVLPVMAGLRVQLKDAAGQVLAGPVHGQALALLVDGGNGGLRTGIRSFEDLVLPEGLEAGSHTVEVWSELWGLVATAPLTITAADDGRTLDLSLSTSWVRTPFTLLVRAGDDATPVPGAVVKLKSPHTLANGDYYLDFARIPERPSDLDVLAGDLLGPAGEALQLHAEWTDWRGTLVATPDRPWTTGQVLDTHLVLPLTVLRARLEDDAQAPVPTVGLEWVQGDLAKAVNRIPMPVGILQGIPMGLALGLDPGSTPTLAVFEAGSGLGAFTSATVPALGAHQDVTGTLPAHAWLDTATLTGSSGKRYVAVSGNAPGLVSPSHAQWILRPTGFTPADARGGLQPDGFLPWYDWQPEADDNPPPGFTDPVIPVPPGAAPAVRIPLNGTVWAAERKAMFTDQGGWWQFEIRPGAFGRAAYTALASEHLNLIVDPILWSWTPQPLRVQDAVGVPVTPSWLNIQTPDGPQAWVMSYGTGAGSLYPDGDHLWHPNLPVGVGLRLSPELPAACGPQAWGSVEVTPLDPAPASPFLLRLDQTVTFFGCPPVAPPAVRAPAPSRPPIAGPPMAMGTPGMLRSVR